MNKQTLKTQPYRGTKDLFPKDFQVQKYIFDTWRQVCESYGYKEYLTPLLEPAELYRKKSGEDVGGKELYTLTDGGGRELALRPEMTPSVTRLISQKYKEWPKPIRLFSIANFFRYERPQKGRTREFWQLNVDIFGGDPLETDIETLKLAVDIMLAFNPPENSFKVLVNDRTLIDAIYNTVNIPQEKRQELSRILDKWSKLGKDTCVKRLADLGISKEQMENLDNFMEGDIQKSEETSFNTAKDRLLRIVDILNQIDAPNGQKYGNYIQFEPRLIRGFDYYDGLVFEVFDTNPENTRSLFGGGRYNGLAELFGKENIPAVGFAPGDETVRLFLKTWNLLPKDTREMKSYCVTSIIGETKTPTTLKAENVKQQVANKLRNQKKSVIQQTATSVTKALEKANSKSVDFTILLGDEELANNTVTIKNMKTGDQETKTLDQFL